MSPNEAWEKLGLDGAVQRPEDRVFDYADLEQKSKVVLIEGQPWVVMVRKMNLP